MNNTKNWFSNWFCSPYYSILYTERNEEEAQHFLDNLLNYINLDEQSSILDVACGKGRHSIYLNSLGYHVSGIDLSKNSIAEAKKHENQLLFFEEFDMRNPYPKTFDLVLNLFTSFGYFDNDFEHKKALENLKNSINEYGLGVIDFMNTPYVLANLVTEETKTIQNIDFHIKRYEKEGYICKEISFTDQEKDYFFTEKVRAFTLADFEQFFAELDMYILDVFGNYKLQKYYPNQSERMILIFK